MAELDTKSSLPVSDLRYGGPISELTREAASVLHLGNRDTAAILIANGTGVPVTGKMSPVSIESILQSFLQFLLDHERYADAANLLWTRNLFTSEPRSVRMLFDAQFDNVANMVPGAASMGKSYDLGVWHYLDWRRDPFYTNVQVVGPSENHLQRNLFSHLVKLHRSSSIPFTAETIHLAITTDTVERSCGIFGVVIPLGKKASGRLQGVKAINRKEPHPLFGPLSRVRVMLEEAENIPVGIWDDVTNILSNVGTGKERFKICAPFNPKDPNGPCAQRCEPKDSWASIDIETSEQWDSKRGWRVTRLDAYKSENVLEGTEKFYGLQTKEGLEKLIQNAGGVGTPGYYTMARGWFPPSGVDVAVIPQHLMHDLPGEFIFVDTPEICAGVDVALEGEDSAIMCLGRCGRASGFRRPKTDSFPLGEVVEFKGPAGNPVRRYAVQLDSIFALPKGDTTRLVAEIKKVCLGARVNGSYLGIDRTGNGAGVHDILVRTFHSSTKGINPSTTPTERRILEEDQMLPCDEYSLLMTELWFGLRKYIEYGFTKVHPNVPQDPLFHEMTGRHMDLGGIKTRVESKKAYRSRGNKSPDRADAFTLMLHAVRLNLDGPPSATNLGIADKIQGRAKQRIGLTDRQEAAL
jgi:hypothetical protein